MLLLKYVKSGLAVAAPEDFVGSMHRRAAVLVLAGIDGQKSTHVDKARKSARGVYDATGSVLTVIALSNHDIDVLPTIVAPP